MGAHDEYMRHCMVGKGLMASTLFGTHAVLHTVGKGLKSSTLFGTHAVLHTVGKGLKSYLVLMQCCTRLVKG